jgi:hypothetical protein
VTQSRDQSFDVSMAHPIGTAMPTDQYANPRPRKASKFHSPSSCRGVERFDRDMIQGKKIRLDVGQIRQSILRGLRAANGRPIKMSFVRPPLACLTARPTVTLRPPAAIKASGKCPSLRYA